MDDHTDGGELPALMTDEQVGQKLQVSRWCIRNLHRNGQLRGVLVGRCLRWRPADIAEYVRRLGNDDA